MNYAAFRKSVLIISLRPCFAVESSLQNASWVDTTTRDLETQLTRMGFILIQQLLIAQRRCQTLHLCDIVDMFDLFMETQGVTILNEFGSMQTYICIYDSTCRKRGRGSPLQPEGVWTAASVFQCACWSRQYTHDSYTLSSHQVPTPPCGSKTKLQM